MNILTFPTIVPGTVTQPNMRISAVDGGATASGGAFVDFLSGETLIAYLNKYLIVKDSTGKTIEGWIKSRGVAESLGANPSYLSTIRFQTDSWIAVNGSPIIIDENSFSVPTSANTSIWKNVGLLVTGRLYKSSYSATDTAGTSAIRSNNASVTFATNGESNIYKTSISGVDVCFTHMTAAGQTDVILASVQQVLTPSATGVTITSTQGGSTYNWAVKTTGFNYNDPAGYTYRILSNRRVANPKRPVYHG